MKSITPILYTAPHDKISSM